jgi:hypothetical protein
VRGADRRWRGYRLGRKGGERRQVQRFGRVTWLSRRQIQGARVRLTGSISGE